MKKAFLQIRTLSALAMASALVACGGGGGPGTAANTAPVPADVSNVTVLAGSAFSFELPAFTDAQGNTLTYKLTHQANDSDLAMPGLSFDPASRRVTGTTALTLEGPLALKIKATDTGGLSGEANFVLNAVKLGIYKSASPPTLFHGVVLPGATGVADVWTWEFRTAQPGDLGFTKYFNAKVANLGAAMSTDAANRRVYVAANSDDESNYSLDAANSVTISPFINSDNKYTKSQTFLVGPASQKTPYTADIDDEWSKSTSLAEFQGVWILKETTNTGTFTTSWTITGDTISGTKKTGELTLCEVRGKVSVAAADKAVARITVTNTCKIPNSTDTREDNYSGISFSLARDSNIRVIDRALIMGLDASSRFVAQSFCRLGTINDARSNNKNCTE